MLKVPKEDFTGQITSHRVCLDPRLLNIAPVGTRPVYKQHRSIQAFTLWKMITESVFLDKSMRFAEDPEYGQLMERLRFGKTTQHDIDSEYKGSILGFWL